MSFLNNSIIPTNTEEDLLKKYEKMCSQPQSKDSIIRFIEHIDNKIKISKRKDEWKEIKRKLKLKL